MAEDEQRSLVKTIYIKKQLAGVQLIKALLSDKLCLLPVNLIVEC